MFGRMTLFTYFLLGITMLSHSQPLVIAHRGNSSAAPENTLAAFKSALSLQPQPQYIEIDLHRSRDGVLIVSHDEDTLRTTGVRGLIREQSYDTLQNLKASLSSIFGDQFKDEKLPTLIEVLDAVKSTPVNVMIECKQLLLEEDVIRVLRERGDIGRHVIASFDELTIYRAKQIEPQVKTLYLVDTVTPGILWRGKDIKADILGINRNAPVEAVALSHAQGFQAWIWTVDEPLDIAKWRDAHADGIISNRPALVLQVIQEK